MKKELKAVLLTAIVYPGAGHFSLKKRLIGCIFASVFTLLLFMTLGDILAIAQCSANEILAGKIPMTASGILQAARNPSGECAQLGEYKYLPLMVVIWLLSMVDAYRLGKKVKPDTQNKK
ncbi:MULTISPECIES: hypothetical protein [Pseudoalteromonas]|uniref:Uncharacterized protein n=1 Tax=Pseudoalteromonas agarivorans DSM 14585 TaxID=1312369 RepID=A0ACA8E2X5_9GAMM|nr:MULTISPECIES: hypothetical protein [Pseudoalteromonas]ATC84674.1 hypothetical protein PAGA_b0828 [Pseudoalteromonas agarivorans DSM 14585]MCK8117169.1 hypothetical protein [Pseudoalteromonas sp. 2CM37A]MCK8133498.1 hypothetical protein [Pseudoalteromonas sp. 2CM28B]HAG41294.1 hypothetical protein [Pseudoalteromonas sp.]|tara:strand:- start:11218 stop:11577 length:360 start_codon:yes stop_codon:yes gene_type:complete